jgi:uncharacterized cupredoxin-like copper-binding protein
MTALPLAFLAACSTEDTRPARRAEPVTFTATTRGLAGPARASAGYVTLTFANDTDSLMAHGLVRIYDDVSPDSGLRAVRIFHGLERGDPRVAMSLFDGFYGGAVFVAPGASKAVGVVLPPGHYVAYADVVGNGRPRVHEGFITPIEVRAAGRPAEAPAADHTIRMVDFGFESPRQVKAGKSRWRVENAGTAVHLAFIARILPGHTYEETKRLLTSPEGSPPVEETGKTLGVHALSESKVNDVELDLEPGEYVLVCFIGGHHMLGMVSPLTVTE